MEETKQWWQSKGVWGAMVTMAIGILGMFGFEKLTGEQENLTEIIMQIVVACSGLLALIGRIKAKKEISKPK
jgi:hypothetical protein